MEKITRSFLALMLMLVGMVSAFADEAPVPPTPKASALVTDGSVEQYLYNVEAGAFLIGANDWGTRASVDSNKGYKVKVAVNADGATYTLNDEAGSKGWNSLDCQGVGDIWVDGAGRAGDAKWTVTIASDGSFKLGNTNVTPGFLSVLPSKGDTKLYISDAEEAQDDWIAVSVEDYAAFAEAKEKYNQDYAAWIAGNAKVGDDVSVLAPASWEGQGGPYGGLANPAAELYSGAGSIAAGNVMTQTISGLKNGKYEVKVEFAGSFTSGRGFECPTGDGLAVAFANTQEENLPIVDRTWVGEGEQNFYTFNVEVTDGALTYGIKNLEPAGNWYVARLASIVLLEVAAPAEEKWFTDNVFCYKDAANNVSRSMELPWVADPADESNGCIALSSAANAGNDHDLQFMIRGAEYDGNDLTKGAFAEGDGFKVTFKVKGDGNYAGCLVGSFNSVAATGKDGWKFGNYLENQTVKMNVTTEWQTVSYMVRATSSDAAKLTAIGFNLAEKEGVARTFYFDDVVIEKVNAKTDDWYYTVNFAAKDYANPDAVYDDAEPNPAAPWATDEAGNGFIKIVSNAKKSNSYESQFFMQIADVAPEGKLSKNDKVIVKFRAKAETANADLKEIQAGAGYHRNYNGNGWISNNSENNVTITVGEWTDIEKTLTITNPDVTNYSLDLTYDADPITYYFDDFSFEYVAGTDDWYLNNKVYAKDFTNGDESYENGTLFPAAPFKDGAVQVKSNASAANDYDSQIFFEIPEDLRGSEVELTMKVKASKEISVAAQLHSSADGNGWSGNPAGDKVDFKVGEWTEVTRVLNTDCKDGKGNDIAYYVLNLSEKGGEAITYQFDDLSIKKYFAPVEWGDLVEVPVEGTLVTEKDWTKETSYSYWSVDMPEGCTRTIENGIVIENTKTDGDPWANQMFTLDGLTLAEGKEYVLRYTLKINGEGDLRADVGPWGTNLVKAPDTQTLENGYRQVVFGIGPCAQEYTGAHAIWQSRKFVGKIIIEKVELFDITPDYSGMDWSDNIVPNGDLATDDMSAFILKNNDVEDPEMLPAEKSEGIDEIGIETVARPTNEDGSVGGNDHDAQFFVRLPYVLPQGTLFNLEFDLYAEEINTLAIQAHGEPGEWKGNMSSVTTETGGEGIVHYQKYLSAPADMRTIAFNLAVATDATYGFSNIKVQIVNDDKAAIEAATATADAATLWAETLALNEACYAGRIAETEGCTEESVKALTDAVAAGKEVLKKNDATKEEITAATEAIEDALAALRGGEGEYLPKPETDPDYANFVEIPQDQGKDLDTFARTAVEEGADFNTYTASGDLQVAFKMYDIDVAGCDYVTVKFAQPAPKGWNIAFWAQGGTDNVEIPEGATEYKYVFADDAKCAIKDDVLPQICVLTLWPGGYPFDMKVYGIYKHKVPAELAYTDLTPEMFFQWSATDETAEAISTSPCDYNIATSTGQPYGLSTVNEDRFADLSAYSTIELTATEGEPRLLFNRLVAEGTVYAEVPRDKDKYETVVENEDGSKTYIVDIAAIVAEYGFAHLHAIKGANWQNTTVNSIKLGYVGEAPEIPVPTNINGVEDGESVKDGKYFINGQIVIVKNGVKYNAAGQVIE